MIFKQWGCCRSNETKATGGCRRGWKKNKKKIIRARVNSGSKEEYMATDEYKARRNTGERKRERM